MALTRYLAPREIFRSAQNDEVGNENDEVGNEMILSDDMSGYFQRDYAAEDAALHSRTPI